MRLCLALKVPHPDYLDYLLTWEQFQDWQEFYTYYPFGDLRADLRTAMLLQSKVGDSIDFKELVLENLLDKLARDDTIGNDEFAVIMAEMREADEKHNEWVRHLRETAGTNGN